MSLIHCWIDGDQLSYILQQLEGKQMAFSFTSAKAKTLNSAARDMNIHGGKM